MRNHDDVVAREATDLATRFAAEGVRRSRRGAIVFAAFAAALLIVSAISSRFSEPTLFGELLHIRIAALMAVGTILYLLATPTGAQRPRQLTIVLMLVMTLAVHQLAQATSGQLSPQYDRMGLIVLGAAILVSWSWAWSLFACATVVGVYVLASAESGGIASPAFAENLGRLVVACLVTVGANTVRERLRWRDLSHVHVLREARRRADAQIRQLNEDLERRVLERTAALRASEARFRTLFEAAPIGMITVDLAGRLLQINRAFADMLHVEPAALVGRLLDDLTVREDGARSLRAHAELRDGAIGAFRLFTRYRRSDGSTVPTHESMVAVRDPAGRFQYALGMVEDISERVRAEEQARAHQNHLAHVLRVTTMGSMVAELAHELNQPLGAIVNFANGTSTRLRQSHADPGLADAVARIAQEGMRAAEIIRRVREFVRPGGLTRTAVDLNHLVREAVELVERDRTRDGVSLRVTLDASLPLVDLDAIQVQQVILNLLHNALDAMRACPDRAHQLDVRTRWEGDGAEVQVCDSGTGIAPAHTDRIFEAFFTTKPGGLGMGLAISRSIVEAYGGRLYARANADHGMTFGFTLPASELDSRGDGGAHAGGSAA